MSKLTAGGMLYALPEAIQESHAAIAQVVADTIAILPDSLQGLYIYKLLDTMPEELLDVLAYDFKVDWWDYDATLDEKREVLKSAWSVHRLKGTKAAVVTAVSALFPGSSVEEWPDYGGDPFHFRLTVMQAKSYDDEAQEELLRQVEYYKNLRSHLDGLLYATSEELGCSFGTVYTGAALDSFFVTPLPVTMTEPGAVLLDYFVLDSDCLA